MFNDSRRAAGSLLSMTAEHVNDILIALADDVEAASAALLAANASDLARMDAENPKRDRLALTPQRIAEIASGIRAVAALPSPVGNVLDRRTRPNGMTITKVSVPFGVIGVIYEARPNVTFDVTALCLKSGNACVLKGGSDAAETNRAVVSVIHRVLRRFGMDPMTVAYLDGGHEATESLLGARGLVDLVIPRGGRRLIDTVREKARVPVIETGAGVCHTYFDVAGDLALGSAVVHNAKTRRVSVCNALDCLVVHSGRLSDLPTLCRPLAESEVRIEADCRSLEVLDGVYPDNLLLKATEESFGTEFLSMAMTIKVVDSIDEAIDHVNRYGSGHSESIITADPVAAERFCNEVDAACVYTNAPTSWTDGAQFGLGAEIGISTQKLHARGPMALSELNTYKWIIRGEGQLRSR